jgi:peroxiredoxin (alkyl hydroperoxide reductase subunit C)
MDSRTVSAPDPAPGPAAFARIGEPLPDFTARSTAGPVTLSDFRGRWLMMFSHPADFTPVCTSEFVAIARAQPRFEALGCALLGLSVDSLYSHLGWIRAIKDRFDVEVRFPVVEDPTLVIARAYGMVAPDAADASAVRATFFIDPAGVLQASTCYPATVGRSVDEMLRLLAALQRVAAGGVLAPAGWTPGADLLAAPADSAAEVLAAGPGSDWFYAPCPDRPA